MGVRLATVTSNTFVGPLPANATETVVLTTPPISMALDNAQVLILWDANITLGTSTTSLVFRVRRGITTAGALVIAAARTQTLAAGAGGQVCGWCFDSPGVVAGQQYCLTVVQTADTVAGVWNDGEMLAMVL